MTNLESDHTSPGFSYALSMKLFLCDQRRVLYVPGSPMSPLEPVCPGSPICPGNPGRPGSPFTPVVKMAITQIYNNFTH